MSTESKNPETIGDALRLVRGLLSEGEKQGEIPRERLSEVLDLPECAAFKSNLTARLRLMVAAAESRISSKAASVELKPPPKLPALRPTYPATAALQISRQIPD